MFDIIIVGAGTAGLTAAIYGARAGMSVLVLEQKMYGGQIVTSPKIENYPGIKSVSGAEFAVSLHNQAKELGVIIKTEKALDVKSCDGVKTVVTPKNTYEGLTVILATGLVHRTLDIEGTARLEGNGISYCATCDGAFYKGQTVAVYGGGDTAVSDAVFLANYCEKVYLIHRRAKLRAKDKLVEKVFSLENIEFVPETVITGYETDDDGESLCGVKIMNTADGSEGSLAVSGLFIAIGQIPSNEAFADVVTLDSTGYIVADESCRVGTKGVYVAGDCRTKAVRQLTTAASDGTVAAIAACEYVLSQDEKEQIDG